MKVGSTEAGSAASVLATQPDNEPTNAGQGEVADDSLLVPLLSAQHGAHTMSDSNDMSSLGPESVLSESTSDFIASVILPGLGDDGAPGSSAQSSDNFGSVFPGLFQSLPSSTYHSYTSDGQGGGAAYLSMPLTSSATPSAGEAVHSPAAVGASSSASIPTINRNLRYISAHDDPLVSRRGRPVHPLADQLRRRGNIAFNNGAIGRSIGFYTRAIASDTSDALLFSNRSIAFSRLGALHAALADADEAVRLDSCWHKAHALRAYALAGLQRHAEAAMAYTSAAEAEQRESDRDLIDDPRGAEDAGDTGLSTGGGHATSSRAHGASRSRHDDSDPTNEAITSSWPLLASSRRVSWIRSHQYLGSVAERPPLYRRLSRQQQRLARSSGAMMCIAEGEPSSSDDESDNSMADRLITGADCRHHLPASSSAGDQALAFNGGSANGSSVSGDGSLSVPASDLTTFTLAGNTDSSPTQLQGFIGASATTTPAIASAAASALPVSTHVEGFPDADPSTLTVSSVGWEASPGVANATAAMPPNGGISVPGTNDIGTPWLLSGSGDASPMSGDQVPMHAVIGVDLEATSHMHAEDHESAGPSAPPWLAAGHGAPSGHTVIEMQAVADPDGATNEATAPSVPGGEDAFFDGQGEHGGGPAPDAGNPAGMGWVNGEQFPVFTTITLSGGTEQPLEPSDEVLLLGSAAAQELADTAANGPLGAGTAFDPSDMLEQLQEALMADFGLAHFVHHGQELQGSIARPERTPEAIDDQEILDAAVAGAAANHVAIQTCAALWVHTVASIIQAVGNRGPALGIGSANLHAAPASTTARIERAIVNVFPWELAVVVGQAQLIATSEAALAPIRHVLCQCGRSSRSDYPHSSRLGWAEHSQPTAALHTVCAECGGISRLVCRPKVLDPTALRPCANRSRLPWHLPPLLVRSASGWRACRHFHVCPNTGRATRHRLSSFHSFRTIVGDEWILRGEMSYTVRVDVLHESCAIAVGAVTPDALVNCDFGWAPGSVGTRREHAWGYIMQAPRALFEDPESTTHRRIWFGGSGTDGAMRVDRLASGGPLPAAQQGDTFRVRLNHADARLEITLRGVTMALALPCRDRGRPLALAVGLKYASDSVTLV